MIEIIKTLSRFESRAADFAGRTPLHCAVLRNCPELIQYLTGSRGQRTQQGYSALMMAVMSRNNKAVELLMPEEAGLRDDNGSTATQIAKKLSNKDAEHLLARDNYVRKMEAYAQNSTGKNVSSR